MTLMSIIISIVMAIGIGLLFYYGFKVSGPWGSFWSFVLILILAGLIAEAWVPPIGGAMVTIPWFSALLFILFFALLIAAATPPRPKTEELPPDIDPANSRTERPGVVALGFFFWLLLIFMLVAAIGGIFYTPPPVVF